MQLRAVISSEKAFCVQTVGGRDHHLCLAASWMLQSFIGRDLVPYPRTDYTVQPRAVISTEKAYQEHLSIARSPCLSFCLFPCGRDLHRKNTVRGCLLYGGDVLPALRSNTDGLCCMCPRPGMHVTSACCELCGRVCGTCTRCGVHFTGSSFLCNSRPVVAYISPGDLMVGYVHCN